VILAHLPSLQIVIPLMAAPACVILRNGRVAWLVATIVTWITFAISLGLLFQVLDGGTISYAIGDWTPPWGEAVAGTVAQFDWRENAAALETYYDRLIAGATAS
jgi:formate hydrogenlyase subunit 3/multisubunit Na+/H+ antiporter MnhD subunit